MKLFTILGAGLLAIAGGLAQAEPLRDDPARLTVLPGWRADGGTHMAAVRIDLAEGWKTYWRAPGDAGIPPVWDLRGSENLGGIGFHWPVPQVSYLDGLRTIGYRGELVLPMELRAIDPAAPIRLRGSVVIGVCETVCVPMEFAIDTTLEVGGARDGQIIAAMIDRPIGAAEAGVASVVCQVGMSDGTLVLTATVDMPTTGREEIVIETADPTVWVSEPDVTRVGRGFSATSRLYSESGEPIALDRSGVRITVLGGPSGAVDIEGCAAG